MVIKNIEFEDIDPNDYPDFTDAMIVYAEHEDGTPLTEAELNNLDLGNYHHYIIQSIL